MKNLYSSIKFKDRFSRKILDIKNFYEQEEENKKLNCVKIKKKGKKIKRLLVIPNLL